MKKIIITVLCLSLLPLSAKPSESLGKIVRLIGDVDITSLKTGKRHVPEVGEGIGREHRIRTGNKSFVEILLANGTKLLVKEVSVLNIARIKMEENDPPSRLKMLTGKMRVITKNKFNRRILLLKTPTTIAGVRGTDFGVITAKDETKLIVFSGHVEVANSNRNILRSFVLRAREEVSIKKDTPPTAPKVVPEDLLDVWFDQYFLDKSKRKILRREMESGIIDKLLRKKKH